MFLDGLLHLQIHSLVLEVRLNCETGLAPEPVKKDNGGRDSFVIGSGHSVLERRGNSICEVISDTKVAHHL
jgi:hypothetical protein